MERSTVGSLLRSSQAYCSQLCDKQTLQFGIAYYSERFAALPEANEFREIYIDDPAEVPGAFAEADNWFEQYGLSYRRCAPAGGQASDELTAFLLDRGFRRNTFTAMVLTKWVDIERQRDIRVLPARAMRSALRGTFLEADTPTSEGVRELRADACAERLDDPPFDMFVALIDNRPAGRCALYQVGDIARVMDLAVLASSASRDVEAALVAHALSLAKRLAMRNICLQIASDDPMQGWFEQIGFTADGTIVEFERDAPSRAGDSP